MLRVDEYAIPATMAPSVSDAGNKVFSQMALSSGAAATSALKNCMEATSATTAIVASFATAARYPTIFNILLVFIKCSIKKSPVSCKWAMHLFPILYH